jgi:hypothetical protein
VKTRALALTLAAALVLWPAMAAADSIFSALGLGEVVTPADIRGRGMGNVTIGVDDPWNLGRGNPAVMAKARAFVFHGELMRESLTIEGDSGDRASPHSTNLPNVRLAVMVPKFAVVGLGLSEYTSVSYAFTETEGAGDDAVIRNFNGKNGLNAVTLTFARQFGSDFSAGMDLDFIVGSYSDIWQTDFVDPDAFDTSDTLTVTHSLGPVLRLGALGSPHPRIDLGAAITFGRELEIRPEIRHGEVDELPHSDLSLPFSLAVGASGAISSRWKAAADLVHTRWSDTDLTTGTDPHLNRTYAPTLNVTELGAGVEYVHDPTGQSPRFWERMPFRAGFAWEPWHFLDVHGQKIHDHFVTAGTGFGLPGEIGMIQVAAQYGWRGEIAKNDAEERILRLGVSFTARERVAVENRPRDR